MKTEVTSQSKTQNEIIYLTLQQILIAFYYLNLIDDKKQKKTLTLNNKNKRYNLSRLI